MDFRSGQHSKYCCTKQQINKLTINYLIALSFINDLKDFTVLELLQTHQLILGHFNPPNSAQPASNGLEFPQNLGCIEFHKRLESADHSINFLAWYISKR